jgi:hypothetical protein
MKYIGVGFWVYLVAMLFFGAGFFVGRNGKPSIYSYPINVIAPLDPDTLLFSNILKDGVELRCFYTEF